MFYNENNFKKKLILPLSPLAGSYFLLLIVGFAIETMTELCRTNNPVTNNPPLQSFVWISM
jgi:hypothetical protein